MPQLVRREPFRTRSNRRIIENITAEVAVPQHPAASPCEDQILWSLPSLEHIQQINKELGYWHRPLLMRLRCPQTNFPRTSLTASATVILRRIVSTRSTRRAATSPQRRPQYDRIRMMVRRSSASRTASGDGCRSGVVTFGFPAASASALTCSCVRKVFSGLPALGSFTPTAGLAESRMLRTAVSINRENTR